MLNNLLAGQTQDIITIIILVAVFALLIVYNFISGKKRKEQAEKEKEKRNAIEPGFKIITIGGIVGTVSEVDDEKNTFVLKTGTEENPSYISFDKVAIYSSENPNSEEAQTETQENGEVFEDEVETTEENVVENEVSEELGENIEDNEIEDDEN